MIRFYFNSVILLFALIGLPAAAQQKEDPDYVGRMTIHELKRKLDRKESIVIIDTRAGNSYLGSSVRIKGSIHITIDELEARMKELPRNKEIVTYCT